MNWPDFDLPPINLWNAPHRGDSPLSPCVGICRIEDNTCVGCHRTLEEIQAWPTMSDTERFRWMYGTQHEPRDKE